MASVLVSFSQDPATMELSTLQNINAAEQLKVFVQNRIRLDGREFTSHRNVSVTKSYIKAKNVYGSSFVKIGETVVVCGINLLVGVPSIDAPSHGDIGNYAVSFRHRTSTLTHLSTPLQFVMSHLTWAAT